MMEKKQNAMMKRYQLFAWMGLIIVLIAFLASLAGANANAIFFSATKATREAAEAGSVLVAANVLRHSIPTWVPSFKFLGLGIMLGAITMALGLIATTLRDLGKDVTSLWPDDLNPGVPQKPRSAKLFPMLMMMGWMLLLIGLIVALWLNGSVTSYWNHSIANELNPAGAGSALLNQLGLITGTLPWLGFLRFMGMALVFTSITVALTVIIRTLQTQENLLNKFVQVRSGGNLEQQKTGEADCLWIKQSASPVRPFPGTIEEGLFRLLDREIGACLLLSETGRLSGSRPIVYST